MNAFSIHKIAAALLALGLSHQVQAASVEPLPMAGEKVAHLKGQDGWPVVPDLRRVGRGETVPVTKVGEVLGSLGESKESVIGRAAAIADAFTTARTFESCARVCEDAEGRTGLLITTNFSHVGCLTSKLSNSCPVGMEPTAETLHTHPPLTEVRANPVDALFTGKRRNTKLLLFPEHFSPQDLHQESSYLMTGGRLLYQNSGRVQALKPGAIDDVLHAVEQSN